MSKTVVHKPTPVNQIPEVAKFEDVKERYRAFREANPEFFKYLDALTEEYNTSLQAAEQAVRSKQVSCGEFILYQYTTSYNAEAAFNALGPDGFLAAGGKISTVTVHELDKERFEAAVAGGAVPKDVADQVIKTSPRYKKAHPIQLP